MKNNAFFNLHPGQTIKLALIGCLIVLTGYAFGQKLQVNDLGYFEKQGVNILVFTNEYNGMFFDEKTAGVEIIHHEVRTSTGGAVRMQNTPEQWDQIPTVVGRNVDKENNRIEVDLHYKDLDFDTKLIVTGKDQGVEINVYLDQPLPEKFEGRAGFNLEFLPSAYFGKTYFADGNPGIFPKYPSSDTEIRPVSEKIPQFAGHTTFDDRGRDEFIVTHPLASGETFVLAPEDPEKRIKIQSEAEIMLFDGRNLAQNGWFIVRSLLPSGKSGIVLTWYLEPNAVPNWKRQPVIGFSQVGYTPSQEKVAVIELDRNDTPLKTASLNQVTRDGKNIEKLKGNVTVWGEFLRYNYAKFDFSPVKEPGIYYIQYGDQKTNTFPISPDVYENIWQPTLDVWFPVQMDHMQVNEAYRTWHGEPFKDDCIQAPLNHQHFDGYRMGDTTDTRYKPFERIPNMAVGGWFDAGDFDIQTGSHNSVISTFVDVWEDLKIDRDQTFIDQETRYVDIHRPDGVPDILQQIEHGTLNVVAQCENMGHPVRGIVVPNLHQYHHLGDAMTETDNLPYNPDFKLFETDGKSSGIPDDRWAFTTRSSYLDLQTAATLAAASRVLKGYNDDLAERSLASAKRLMEETNAAMENSENDNDNPMMRWRRGSDMNTVLELYITTKEQKYLDRFLEQIWPSLEPRPQGRGGFGGSINLGTALKALPYMDAEYKAKLKKYVVMHKKSLAEMDKQNPYGVPVSLRTWGGSGTVVSWAITNYYAYKAFPEVMSKEDVLKGLNYLFGCHPHSNVSFVNAVGVHTKNVAYGNNRADFTTIAGGIVPGLILLKPDYLENKDDWPFLWGENEVTIGVSAQYIQLGCAVNDLLNN